jgi:tyrosyl-tRNA synthetase
LLTDVQLAEIEKMKRETHPMQAKKELARRIVEDFHSAEAGVKAGEDWARDFQKGEEVAEKVIVPIGSIEAQSTQDRAKPPWADEETQVKHLYLPDEETIKANWDAVVGGSLKVRIARVEKLLVQLGLVSSTTEGSRKLKEDAVTIKGEKMKGRYFAFVSVPAEAYVRVGRKKKIASIVF